MGDRKMIFVESSITKQSSFSKCLAGVLNEADALARLCDVKTDVLIISPVGRPYVFKSPCHNFMVEHIRNHKPKRKISPSSLKQARILKSQAKLDRIMKQLEHEKERGKVLKKRQQESMEKRKKIEDLKLDELIAFKEKLEALREKIKDKQTEGETSSSEYIDILEKKNKI